MLLCKKIEFPQNSQILTEISDISLFSRQMVTIKDQLAVPISTKSRQTAKTTRKS